MAVHLWLVSVTTAVAVAVAASTSCTAVIIVILFAASAAVIIRGSNGFWGETILIPLIFSGVWRGVGIQPGIGTAVVIAGLITVSH